MDPERLGGQRYLANDLNPTRLRGQDGWGLEELSSLARGDGELKAGQENAYDRHTNTCSQACRASIKSL
jgi:hypothetical protein